MGMVIYRKYINSRGSYFKNGSELWTFLIDDHVYKTINSLGQASHLELIQLVNVATVKDPANGHEVIIKCRHDISDLLKAGLDAMSMKYHTSENVRESFKKVELLAELSEEQNRV